MTYDARMTRVALTLLIISLVGVSAVSGQQRPEREVVTPPTIGVTGAPPVVKIWTDKGDDKSGSIPVYYVGERIYISFQVDKDSYVTIYDVDSTGNVNILFPNPYHTDNLARGGRIYTLPGTHYEYDLVIQGPTGKEIVYALASTHIYYHWQYCRMPPPVWSDTWGAPCTWGHSGGPDQTIASRRLQKRLQVQEEANLAGLTVNTIKKQIELKGTVGCEAPRQTDACQTSFYVTVPPY